MRAEFHRPAEDEQEAAPTVVGVATWNGSTAILEAEDAEVRTALERVFRPVPVAVDDASLRPLGTHGAVVLEPGSLEWFRAAALSRVGEHGLAVRFVPGVRQGGFDPAGQYRGFGEAVRRLEGDAPLP